MRFHALTLSALSLAFSLSAASADVISERKANFRKNVDALKAISKAIPENDFTTIATAATVVAEWSRNMTAFFPEGSDQGDTKARAEIWLDWERFETLARDAEANALALAALAKAGDSDALPGALNTLSGSCKTCHKSFKD